jgi:hypothetical protein
VKKEKIPKLSENQDEVRVLGDIYYKETDFPELKFMDDDQDTAIENIEKSPI